MVGICIPMLLIWFEWLEFGFECFESLSNGSNLHSNASNPFEWFEFGFECFESFQMVRIPFEWLEFGFDFFEPRLKDSNLHSNAQNLVQMVRLLIQMLRIPFKWFKFTFECFEFLSNALNLDSNASNLDSNASNPFQIVRIWICKLAFECFNSCGCNLLYVVDNVGSLDTAHSKQQTTCIY